MAMERRREQKMTCYTLAQHFRTDEGTDPAKRGAMFGNRYNADVVLVEGEAVWKMEKLVVRCVWVEGDLTVLN